MNQSARALLGGLVVVTILCAGVCAACTSSVPSPTAPGPHTTPKLEPSAGGDDYVELVYFHRTKRCYSCQYAGDMTRYVVETYFADETADGRLLFKELNVQDSSNAAMIDRYGAYGSSLFVNAVIDGEDHIRHVAAIWYHIGDDDEFVSVLRAEIGMMLESI